MKKQFKLLLMLGIVLVSFRAKAQFNECGGIDNGTFTANQSFLAGCPSNPFSGYTNKYKAQATYIPKVTDPVITLKIVIHVAMPTIKTSNTWDNSTDPYGGLPGLYYLFNKIQNNEERYSLPRAANYSGTGFNPTYIYDSKFRFEVVGYYFYHGDNFYNSYGYTMGYIQQNYPQRLAEGLAVVIVSGQQQKHMVNSNLVGFVPALQVTSVCGIDQYSLDNNTIFTACQVRHEIGHAVGFAHTYYPSCCHESGSGVTSGMDYLNCNDPDYLYDVFAVNNPTCPLICPNTGTTTPNGPTSACGSCYEFNDAKMGSNNMMSADAVPVAQNTLSPFRWISPLQMGRRIRSMHLMQSYAWASGTTSNWGNLRAYAKEMVSGHINTWVVDTNETWEFDIQMYKDIIVKAGKTLTIKCKVAMPTDGKIIVEKGAKLSVDGGTITAWCLKTPSGSLHDMPCWEGIEVAGDPAQNQLINNSTGYSANQGIVEIKNGAIISYAHKAIKTSLTNAAGVWQPFTSGGIVIASNCYFINNVYDIILYKYQNGNAKSKLTNCMFKTTGEIGRTFNNSIVAPKEHVKLFDNSGLNIYGCTFEYAAGNTYAPGYRGIGLLTTDANFNVDWNCQAGNCTSSSVRTKFINLTAGAWIDNSNSLFTGTIKRSDFTDNEVRAAMAENSYNLIFSDNTISMNGNQEGVYLYKSKYYAVKSNTIAGQYWQGGGVIAYDSKDGLHQVYRNTFTGLNTGILAVDNNGGQSVGSYGLKMNCNVFNSSATNAFDIGLTYSLAAMPIVMKAQSPFFPQNSTELVRNLYGATYMSTTQNKWFVDATNTQSIWHASTPTGTDNPNVPNTQASSQIQVLTYFVPFTYSSDCPAVIPSSGGPASSNAQMLTNLNTYITDARSNSDLAEVQAAVSSKMNLFATDSLPEGRDSVIAVLQSNQGGMDDADVLEVFGHIWKADYTTATSKANALASSHTDWKNLLLKIIELKQDSMDYYSLLTNDANVAFLEGYAGTEGKDGQASAQAILHFVFGTDHDYPIVYPPMPEGGEERQTSISEISNPNMNLYPNPTHNGITLVNTAGNNESVKVEVKDLLGRVIYTNFSKESKTDIPMTTCGNGVYIVTVSKNDKEIIYRSKIMKQD